MRLAAVPSGRLAEYLAASWHHSRRRGQLVMVIVVVCLAMVCAMVVTVSLVGMSAAAQTGSPLAGTPVPAQLLPTVKSAAGSCPELTAPRLAAQLMAASGFKTDATTADGGSGVAGLTSAQWRQWVPAPGAKRSDPAANVVALAHDMCDLAGRVRAGRLHGNLRSLALAAFHSGLHAVVASHGIPAGAASYVAAVTAYAAWYALQPAFGGSGTATPTPRSSSRPSPTPRVASATEAAGPAYSWRLTWSDEFSGPAGSPPDASKWSHDTGGGGWGNSELEYYTTSTANAELNGHGQLVITASTSGASSLSCWYGPCSYTSARLVTLGHFAQAYGQISARIELPLDQGMWPSFWALGDNFPSVGWPLSGQMDIATSSGHSPASVSAGLIGPGLNAWSGTSIPGASADTYHTFTVDWYRDHVSFYIDGRLYGSQYRVTAGAGWVFDHPFFLILNLAVGGTQPGTPGPGTTFPQQMLVDWVRAYTADPPTAPVAGRITGLAGKCAEAAGTNGGAVRIDDCDGSAAQAWTLSTDGTVRAMGQCLTASGTANGAATQLSPCDGSAAQAWQAETNRQLVNAGSGRCLDVTDKSSANLTPLQIWDCWGASNQVWTLP